MRVLFVAALVAIATAAYTPRGDLDDRVQARMALRRARRALRPDGEGGAGPACTWTNHLDLDGEAVVWGMNHKTDSAEECCQRCKDFKPRGGKPCMMWVWCGDPSGVCWSMDIWNHTTGECWLKYQEGWDGNPDLDSSNIRINQRGAFAAQFRREHRTAPLMVPWTAGVLAV
mmetsp:Transcript_50051/g.160158  ORF Transcript_50051/g.160158 Transcript_50051/m.160158 type:complete len:172 (+) Transcript_50051:262-777(+)